MLVQVRDISRALRGFRPFAVAVHRGRRPGSRRAAFQLRQQELALPASESEYQEGIKSLDRYLARLSDPNQPNAQFYARADNLNNWLGDVATRLLAVPAPVGERRPGQAEHQHQEPRRGTAGRGAQGRGSGPGNPWLQIDNVFYEARGQAWALSHLLRAIEVDFADVLAKKNATVSVRQIIRELEAAQEPLWSPMVLNGSGYGILANHSLVMANFPAPTPR